MNDPTDQTRKALIAALLAAADAANAHADALSEAARASNDPHARAYTSADIMHASLDAARLRQLAATY